MQDPEIHPAAHDHEVADTDILYVYANPMRVFTEQGDWELTMHVGLARNGVTLIEVGFDTIEGTDDVVIFHAMRVRPQRAHNKYGL